MEIKFQKEPNIVQLVEFPIDRVKTENKSKLEYEPSNSGSLMFRKAFWDERFFAWLVDMLIVGISLGIIGIFSWLTGQSFNWWTIWSG